MRGNRCLTGCRRKDAGGAIDDFERLVAAYQNRIYGVALRLTSSPEVAADLTQETFLRAFRGWKNFRKESQAYTWLYRILVNLNKDRIGRETRRRSRETSLTSEDGIDAYVELPDSSPNPSECAERGELRGILAKAIDDLQPGYKECVVLKDVEGLSYEQIAEVMGITVEAVRSRLARARQQLRQSLAPYLKA
ncbi:MAG TPA: sigma-70 family RNA polymerase sigma factor [Fimbriimonadales bacterium]|nr:sigma-70 family RNA polymerase sigma factor [Fimbriimonadales bacterium]